MCCDIDCVIEEKKWHKTATSLTGGEQGSHLLLLQSSLCKQQTRISSYLALNKLSFH